MRWLLESASVKVDIPADIHKALWEKFLLVTAFGGAGAVSRAPIGIMRTMPETRALLEQWMEEVSAVARARGIRLSDAVVETVCDTLTRWQQMPRRRYNVILLKESQARSISGTVRSCGKDGR